MYLGLAVGAQVSHCAIATKLGHLLAQTVGKDAGHGHQLGSLVRRIAEHETLVTSANLLLSGSTARLVDSLGNVGGLLLNGNHDVAGLVVEALGRVVVADLLDSTTDDLLVIEVGVGRDLAKDHDHAGLGGSLAANTAVGILAKALVQDGIGNLIADLIRVSLADRLACKEKVLARHAANV